MQFRMPYIKKGKAESSSNETENSLDTGLKLHPQNDAVSESYLFGNQKFYPTTKVIVPNKFSIMQNRKEIFVNQSYREVSQSENYASHRKLQLENSDDYLSKIKIRKKSIKPHYSPQNEPFRQPIFQANAESQKRILVNVIDDMKLNMKQLSKQEQLQKQSKNAQVHNFYFQKNMKHIYPFQLDNCVKDLMRPVQLQREHLLSPIQTEKSLIYPQRPKVKKHPKFLEKIKKRMLLRRKTIFLPQIQIYQDPIVRKLKHFQKSTFQNQCIHMIYIRPSAIRVQRFMIDDPQNEEILKKCFSYRWWWKEKESNDDEVQFYWSSKPNKDFLNNQRSRHISDKIEYQPFEEILSNLDDVEDQMKFALEQKLCLLSPYIKTHNHIEVADTLWTKKTLVSQVIQFQTLSGQNDVDVIPQSAIVENLGDLNFNEFLQNHKQTTDLWVVQKCEKAEGINVKICEDAKSIFTFIHLQYQVPNRKQQTFTIQKYIRAFSYFQEKIDFCYFLLVTQINGIVRGYMFEQFYGEKSHLKFSPFNEKKPYDSNENEQQDSQIVFMDAILEQLNENSADYHYDIFPTMQEIVKEYLKSIFIKMPVKDHNFQLLKVVFIVDQQFKPWLINVKPIETFPNEPELKKDIIPLLIDNVIQLTLDVLFPSPLIWVKEKKKLIESYPEKNIFQMVFDSRLDAQGLKSLFETQVQETIIDEEI